MSSADKFPRFKYTAKELEYLKLMEISRSAIISAVAISSLPRIGLKTRDGQIG